MMKPIICSFCGKSSDEVKRMVTGPDVHICCECVDTCIKLQSGISVPDWMMTTSRAVECSFCGKRPRKRRRVLVNPSSTICEDCVKTTQKILEERGKLRGQINQGGPLLKLWTRNGSISIKKAA